MTYPEFARIAPQHRPYRYGPELPPVAIPVCGARYPLDLKGRPITCELPAHRGYDHESAALFHDDDEDAGTVLLWSDYDDEDDNGRTRVEHVPNTFASFVCQCEHSDHFDATPYSAPTPRSSHAYQIAVLGTPSRISAWVGNICAECDATHPLPKY